MKICPKCGRKFERLLAVSRMDNKTMICDNCGTMEALVAATGNKWAMENFNDTHN